MVSLDRDPGSPGVPRGHSYTETCLLGIQIPLNTLVLT